MRASTRGSARSSSARCWISSTSATSSSRRRAWSSRNSPASGRVESDLKEQGRTFADEGTTEEKAREEYRGIAERRVRLGLVIAEIGEKNNIKVTEEQLRRGDGADAADARPRKAGVGLLS